uniref:Uncharacterized protein n=1 Tax=Plectus sambesii TaxID=2011161 RepID=A0A914X1F3_9BILA
MEECAVLLVAPRIDANNGAPRLQRRNICVQCEEASADSMKLLQFPTDEAKWKHAWEHVRLTYSVATEPNPSVEAIKNNSRCKAFFHEKCFPLKKVPQPQVHRKRSCVGDIEGAIRPVASNTAKRLNSLDHDWPLQEKSFNILKDIAPTANGICSNSK